MTDRSERSSGRREHSPRTDGVNGPGTSRGETGDGPGGVASPEEVLAAFSDAQSREILATTSRRPWTVPELVEMYDLSSSTAYRKVNRLVEMGLLEERLRVRSDGSDICEYASAVGSVHVRLPGSGAPEVTVSVGDGPGPDSRGRVSTDGGTPENDPDDRGRRLQEIFVDVTGTDELVEKQDAPIQSRYLDDDASVSGYVTTLARDDGLTDTLPAPEAGDRD